MYMTRYSRRISQADSAATLWRASARLVDELETRVRQVVPRSRRVPGYQDFEVEFAEALRLRPDVRGGDLADLFFAHEGRRAWKWLHYFEAYNEQFARFRNGFLTPDDARRPLRLLELGVMHGGSLQLWRKFFAADTTIVGIDIDPRVAAIDDEDLTIRIGSQTDADFLYDVVAEMGGVDIVIDDGSHYAEHQRASFEILFPLLSSGGVYVVEDLHTSYWWQYGGAYARGQSFIEHAKKLVDDMHAWYHGRRQRTGVNAREHVQSVSFYDSLVFIRKGQHTRPASTQVGRASF